MYLPVHRATKFVPALYPICLSPVKEEHYSEDFQRIEQSKTIKGLRRSALVHE
jgi:hypothetical protein